MPAGTVLNLNVPGRRREEITGFAVTRLGGAVWMNQVERRVDDTGRAHYWLATGPDGVVDEPGTDHAAVAEGLVSITPIHIDLTHRPGLDLLTGWELEETWKSLGGDRE
ncbi:MAG: hypothetical protein RDU89_09930 [bacterium]|nr:hypothetical protein [bacterium]